MSRKKVSKITKAKKPVAKLRSKATAMSLTDTLEQNLREIPAKLLAQHRKDVAIAKQQEKKLKTELKRTLAQKKTAQKQRATLAAKAKTAAAKKQLATAKKILETITKTITDLSAQLTATKQQIKIAAQKQIKFSALSKQINKFEKEWALKIRKAAKSTAERRKKTGKKSAKSHTIATHNTAHEAPIAMQSAEIDSTAE